MPLSVSTGSGFNSGIKVGNEVQLRQGVEAKSQGNLLK